MTRQRTQRNPVFEPIQDPNVVIPVPALERLYSDFSEIPSENNEPETQVSVSVELRWLEHGIGELQDAIRAYQQVYVMLSQDPEVDESVLKAQNIAHNSVLAAQRYIRKAEGTE